MTHRSALLACSALLGASALLRAWPLWNDFWLDEIWSWQIARQLGSAVGVFTAIHHSNNHHLMTLWLYAVGDEAHQALYRLPAWLSGVASVGLGAALAWRRDRLEAVLAALLLGACFALIHFSSEARGYAPAVAFSLAALWLLERHLERPRLASALGFGVCVSLALLSQLVSLFFWSGALAWSGWRLWRRRQEATGFAVDMAQLHALPALLALALGWVDLRHFVLAGGNPTDVALLVSRGVGFSLGLPVWRSMALPYALLTAGALAAALYSQWRRGDDRWLLYAVTLVLAPLVAVVWVQPQVLAVRYFLIGIALALLIAAGALARAWRAGGATRSAALVLLALYLVGNAVHMARFLEHGRGGYRAALLYMAAETRGSELRVASDHDFRTGHALRFYARELPRGMRLAYRTRGSGEPAEWFVRHWPQRPTSPPAFLTDPAGRRYRLAAEFDHGAISGFYWAIYRWIDSEESARLRSSTTPKPPSPKGSAPMRSIRS